MKLLLSALILVLIGTQTLSIDASLAPGLSLKNALLYATAIALVARLAISGEFRLRLVALQAAFVFLILYAFLSWLVMIFLVQHPSYSLIFSAVNLKGLIDFAIFFAVFFYGARSADEALAGVKALLLGVVVANVVTVLDASGVLGWNVIAVQTEHLAEFGRVQGAFGEANQHAAVVVMTLPAICALALISKGAWRAFWWTGVVCSVAALVMTASRGAIFSILVACIWAAFVFRRYLSLGRIFLWGVGACVLVTGVVLGVSEEYSTLMKERLVGITLSGNLVDASSGRTAVWGDIVRKMLENPWSLVSGFGWDAYSVMGFDYNPHNTYLGLWFNLGLPGLLAFLCILGQCFAVGFLGFRLAPSATRAVFAAFVVGFAALCVSIAFVELAVPWLYVWIFVGLIARAAVSLQESAANQVGAAEATSRGRGAPPSRMLDAPELKGRRKNRPSSGRQASTRPL